MKFKVLIVSLKLFHNSLISILLALLLGGGCVYYLLDESGIGTIQIDGEAEDWEGIPKTALQSGNIDNSNIDLETVAVNADNVYLSFLTETKEPLFQSDNGDLLRILIDSDNTTETGYFVPGMGADFMIEIFGQKSPVNDNKTIYSSVLYIFDSSRDPNDWNAFAFITHIEVASKGDVTECRVPLFDLGVGGGSPMKMVWQTSDTTGLTDLGEVIVGINTENVLIENVILSLQRPGENTGIDNLEIDGYFDDWRNIEKYQDSDWNEYQEGPEPVDNPSVDLHEYASVNDGFDFFFYLSVYGEVLSGTAIPVDEAKQQPSS